MANTVPVQLAGQPPGKDQPLRGLFKPVNTEPASAWSTVVQENMLIHAFFKPVNIEPASAWPTAAQENMLIHAIFKPVNTEPALILVSVPGTKAKHPRF